MVGHIVMALKLGQKSHRSRDPASTESKMSCLGNRIGVHSIDIRNIVSIREYAFK